MVATRSSQEDRSSTNGTKRSAADSTGSSPPAKREKKSEKEQKTIEEMMGSEDEVKTVGNEVNGSGSKDKREKEEVDEVAMSGIGDDTEVAEQIKISGNEKDEDRSENAEPSNGLKEGEKNAFDKVKADSEEVKLTAEKEKESNTKDLSKSNESLVDSEQREAKIPSSILEKGIIYFFFRGRVGVEDPQGIEDVARSYILLRPLPVGAKLGEGPLADDGNARLLALPKKMLPKSERDRFLLFVEESKSSIAHLVERLASNDYSTKTQGTSHIPAAAPFAEGVYVITSTGRESHLAYQISCPEIGDIQKDLGVYEKGSFVLSIKNPKTPSPGNSGLDNPAQYPDHLQKKFRELRWMPADPEFLDYERTQILFIGESFGNFGHSLDEMSRDKSDNKTEKPEDEIDQLLDEDHDRIENLKENDPIFADLGLSLKEYESMKTTW